MVIRVATDADVHGLARIHLDRARHHHDLDPESYIVPPEDAAIRSMQERVAAITESSVVIAAEVGSKVAGFAATTGAAIELTDPITDAWACDGPVVDQVGAAGC